jgi:putative tryptophan/tyrosine transport system substrate-binding protein
MKTLALGTILALGLLAAPLAVEAQPVGKGYRIGLLATFPGSPLGDVFVNGLREHGYVEGQNLPIERRFSEGKADRLPALVADLLRLDVRLIVVGAPGPSRAARDATTTVPIVFVGVADPIGTGLVTSLARPGGNVTGLASVEWEAFFAKQLQVIKEALPRTSRVAILMNPINPMHALALPQEQAAANTLGLKLQLIEARDASELERAFEVAVRGRADVLHVWGDPLTFAQRARIAELAMKHRLPTMHLFGEAVEAGGLLGFGPDWVHIWRNAAKYVDKIIKGTKPGDIPVEQPTKYQLVINLKTAKVLRPDDPPVAPAAGGSGDRVASTRTWSPCCQTRRRS